MTRKKTPRCRLIRGSAKGSPQPKAGPGWSKATSKKKLRYRFADKCRRILASQSIWQGTETVRMLTEEAEHFLGHRVVISQTKGGWVWEIPSLNNRGFRRTLDRVKYGVVEVLARVRNVTMNMLCDSLLDLI